MLSALAATAPAATALTAFGRFLAKSFGLLGRRLLTGDFGPLLLLSVGTFSLAALTAPASATSPTTATTAAAMVFAFPSLAFLT